MTRKARVLCLARYDAFLRAATLVGAHFAKAGAEVDIALIAGSRMLLSTEQKHALGLGDRTIPEIPFGKLTDFLMEKTPDILVCAMDGASFRHLFLLLDSHPGTRPLIVACYPGLVLRYADDGFSSRAGADFLWLNTEEDKAHYEEMCRAFGVDPGNARVLGLPSLLARIGRNPGADGGPIVFFEQAVIPRSPIERRYLAAQLITLARHHPSRLLQVKPRGRPGEPLLHRTQAHIAPLLTEEANAMGGWPDNLSLTYEPVEKILAQARYALTISSTVAIEAIHAQVPTAIIGDFGAHDDSGLRFFYGSSLITTLAAFDPDNSAEPDLTWRMRAIADPNDRVGTLVQEVLMAIDGPRRPFPGELLWSPELRHYLTSRMTSGDMAARAYMKPPPKKKGLRRRFIRFWASCMASWRRTF